MFRFIKRVLSEKEEDVVIAKINIVVMKINFKSFISLAISSIFFSCNNSNTIESKSNEFSVIENAHWLIGEWQNTSSSGILTETWEKLNDSTYAGKSFFVIGKDTVSSETIRIEQHGKTLLYIPTVKNQNNEEPISFVQTSSSSKQMIFENQKHDFPQLISYTQTNKTSLVAEISGVVNGKNKTQSFPMQKVNE